jgi:hypothetical protein
MGARHISNKMRGIHGQNSVKILFNHYLLSF